MSPLAVDRRVREQRPPKPALDPWRPFGSLRERERTGGGAIEEVLAVFLTGAECPFSCVFCDLWRFTLDSPTPPGALPRQLQIALAAPAAMQPEPPPPGRIKLYNASNFFDPHAVPAHDRRLLAELVADFPAVTVESHPAFLGPSCLDFAERIGDSRLEVAIGLETVHPETLEKLNKRMAVPDFDRAADFLSEHGVDLRVFVLVGPPFLGRDEAMEWTLRSVEHALARGARHVALIPVRLGNGEMDRLAGSGAFVPPVLADLEEALERSLALAGDRVVTADLWDAERFATCPECREDRVARLRNMNLSGQVEPRPSCDSCGIR